jgi:hypothetical protein
MYDFDDIPAQPPDIWAYQQRILALEDELTLARRGLKHILRRLEHAPARVDLKVASTQLDLINSLIRLANVQIAYYVKLGQVYDLAHFHGLFIQELKRRDPALAMEIIEALMNPCPEPTEELEE